MRDADAMRQVLSDMWNDYADSHLWVGMEGARYSGFEHDNIYRYAELLNGMGVKADPDAKLEAARKAYEERGGEKDVGEPDVRP